MARTQLQIEQALISSIENNDPGNTASYGPIRLAFVTPHAAVLRDSEVTVDDLAFRYSLRYIQTRNPDILDLYTYNHGMLRGSGTTSKVSVIFFTYSVPLESIFIPRGTQVTTIDKTVTFITTEDVTAATADFDLYFNSTRRRYEIPVNAESIGVGSTFQISAGRLRALNTSINGIAGVDQLVASSPSTSTESNDALGRRQQSKFVGTTLGSPNGLESLVRDYDTSNITDVTVVSSTEYDLFRRPLRRPGFDIYIAGSIETEITESFVAIDGQTTFYLNNLPALSLSSVLVNGESVAASLIVDNLPASSQSAVSKDKVVLANVVPGGASVLITYVYNQLIADLQTYILQSNKRLWQSDILIRQAINIQLNVELDVTAMSSEDLISISSLVPQAVFTTINTNQMGVILFPNDVVSSVLSNVTGISKIIVRKFQRSDQLGLLAVDVVEMKRNELAFLTSTNLTINIHA